MSNDVPITPGSGAEVATDEVNSRHYQLVKLVDGAEDSEARLGGDAGNGLDVDVTRVQGSVAVTGTFWPGTQPVSGTVAVSNLPATQPVSGTVTANAGTGTFNNQQSNKTADFDTGAGADTVTMFGIAVPKSGGAVAGGTSTDPIRTDPTGATTQPVSGTVTANAGSGTFTVGGTVTANVGTTNGLALDATLTGGTQKSKLVDTGGTNVATVSAAGALKVDGSAVTQPVSGTFWQATQPVSGTVTANAGSGTFTIQQSNITTDYDTGAGTQTMTMFGVALPASGGAVAGGTATNPLQVSIANTGANATAVKVDGSAVTQPVSGTFWQATQPVSGTVTANAGTGTFTVSGTVSITANSSVNVAQLAGTTTDTNSGAKSAGTLRVVLATDQPQLTNKLLVTPDANSAINVAQIGGSSVVTAATGVQKVGIVGNAGATVDSTVAAGTAPTNQVVVGSVYNSAAPAPTSGQAMAHQADQAGNLRVFPGMPLAALAAWNSATALNATQTIFTNSGAEAVLVHLVQTTTLTAGAITFEVSYDGLTWVTVPADAVLDPSSTTFAQISLPYTVQASTNKPFIITGKGWQALRIKLSTQITGTGSVTPNYALLPYDPAASVIGYSPTAANFNAQVVGAAATGATVVGNPLLDGGRAQNALPSAVSADGQAVPFSLDRQGVIWTRARQMASYAAAYRLANATAGQLSLTFTFVANTDKQLATIYHANTAAKIVKIRRVSLVVSTGAAGVFNFEIKPLSATTAPATGNPAITPGKFDPADAGAEATCLALPTTAGSLVGTDSPVSASFEWNAATAVATANPAGLSEQEIVLYDSMIAGPEIKPLIMRAATAEGYAVVGRCTAAVALRFSVLITFTEE